MNHEFLIERVRAEYPDARIDVTEFSSGAVDIAIRFVGRLVVIQHTKGAGYGVSAVADDESCFVGHDVVCADPGEVLVRLRELLSLPEKPSATAKA